jgi:HD-GYP domain-containing protein (c-di-GMP phosphodiesterase class II)
MTPGDAGSVWGDARRRWGRRRPPFLAALHDRVPGQGVSLRRRTRVRSLVERAALLEDVPAAVRVPVEGAVEALVRALAEHHLGTAEHSNRLAVACRGIGRRLRLGPDPLFELELVAILHDIGKLAVPTDVLDATRGLEAGERELIRTHTARGAEMLAEIAGLMHLAPLVRATHERWDGQGYPDGLAAEEIPLAARIVFAVDSFDAMTHDRPYRRALDHEEARRRIAAGAGTAFDPAVARVLLEAT